MPRFVRHPLSFAAVATVLALMLGGCKTTSDPDTTGSISGSPRSDADWRRAVDINGERYRANPKDVSAAIAYARALRATEQRSQAVAVLEQTAMQNPNDPALLGAYGRALADNGQYPQALDALSRAHTPDNPDWRILNAQGAVLDQMGKHTEAQRYYNQALKISPEEPSILSNLGLSYALMKDLKNAEKMLRLATIRPGANQKARQNLALVVGLQGRFAEAEQIASADLPPDEAAANVAYLRQLIDQQKAQSAPAAQRAARRSATRPTVLPKPDSGT